MLNVPAPLSKIALLPVELAVLYCAKDTTELTMRFAAILTTGSCTFDEKVGEISGRRDWPTTVQSRRSETSPTSSPSFRLITLVVFSELHKETPEF